PRPASTWRTRPPRSCSPAPGAPAGPACRRCSTAGPARSPSRCAAGWPGTCPPAPSAPRPAARGSPRSGCATWSRSRTRRCRCAAGCSTPAPTRRCRPRPLSATSTAAGTASRPRRGGGRARRAARARRPRRTFTVVSVLTCLGLVIGALLATTYLDVSRTGRGTQPLVLPTPGPVPGGTGPYGTDPGGLAPDDGGDAPPGDPSPAEPGAGAGEEPEDSSTYREPEEPLIHDAPAHTPRAR